MKTIKLIVIVAALVFLAGCASQTRRAEPPTLPNIHWMFDAEKMTCITSQDTVLLFKYMQYMEMKVRDGGMPALD